MYYLRVKDVSTFTLIFPFSFRRVSLQENPMPSLMEQWHQESASRDLHVAPSHYENQVLKQHQNEVTSFDANPALELPTPDSQDLRLHQSRFSETPSGDRIPSEKEEIITCDKEKTSKRTVNNYLEFPNENSRCSWRKT